MTKSVLISKDYFPPQLGGISTMMWEICRALGPDRVCVVTEVEAGRALPPRLEGIRVFRRHAPFSKNVWQQLGGIATAIAEVGLLERPRVVQLGSCDEAHLGYYLRWTGLPHVVYAYGNDILSAERSRWLALRKGLFAAARIITISRYSAGLLRRMGLDERKIVIVHPGCNVERYFPRSPPSDLIRRVFGDLPRGPVLLTVGGLVPRKGQDIVLRALPTLTRRYPTLRYILVGTGPYRDALERLAGELGIRSNVVFAGGVPLEELPDYFALADVFVMPSRASEDQCDVEGFGIVFLEANSCGKPVIGGRSGGVLDAIIDGQTGLLVDPLDPESVATAATQLLDNPALAKRLGERGRARAVRDFSWPAVGARVGAVLDEVGTQADIRKRSNANS